MFDCWRSVLCKKTGSNLHSSLRRSDEAEKEEGDPQIDVPDVIRLVRDPPEQSHPPADEIMHQDITPLCAADIQDQLKKRFAYLSGGRGQDGSPVITFPDYPAFSDVPDKEFQNVMTYLTSIPSLQDAGIGFILVIDRRQDKWTSVKASILRIAASFPANLQLVLVLRPTGFFQRALSDLAFKFNRDDLKMKVPVIMLSSVPELHGYIDKSQLTEDLGGTLDYCHTRWLCHRTAIESFALMVKQTAQMLQSFGTELAETELPNDVQSTSSVLCAHTEKKDKAKVHVVSVLLAQLNETEAAFDEFWAKHQQKLQQCLQLRHFEQDFREVKSSLDALAQKIATFTDVGNSLAHAEHLLRVRPCQIPQHPQTSKSSAPLSKRAPNHVLHGGVMKLIDTKHYAVDSIRPKCHELQYLCDQFAAEVERKRQIEKFLETGAENKIQELNKIYQDYESILTKDLMGAHDGSGLPQPPVSAAFWGYAAELDNPLMAHLMSPGLQNKKDILFGNMEEIYHFHNRIFLRELEEYTDCPELVGRCFLERMEEFQIYEKYCQNKPRSESLWRQCSDCPFFQECQRKLDHKLSLDSYLLKPVQRITKYQLLLKEMLKYSKSCEGAEDLQEALSSILGILKAVNDSMHLIAITGYDGNLSDLGKLLMQGSFSVWTDHKKGHSKVKDLARFKPMQRHLFLHEKAVLFCKKREENGEGYEKAPSYSYKQSLNMAAVGITENVKGDVRKFEIWYNAREEVYIVQAPTPEVKAAWVSEIRKVLTSQLQACREASQHRTLEQSQSLPLPTPPSTSPSKGTTRNIKKLEERKTDPLSLEGYMSPSSLPKPPEKGRDDMVTSSTSESSALSRKRFTLQGFANLKGQKASPTSPDKKPKRHEVKSDPTPFGLRGWSKTSHPLEAPEDNDGWSSAEELMNSSDAEEEGRVGPRKLVPGKYTVVVDDEKGSPEALAVRNGDMVEVVQEGDEGLWYVRNLTSSKESWVPASSLSALLGVSGSAQCLSSSESSAGSTLLSASSSCSESCGVPLSDLQG
ncbi:guanine nucleotide exchange factor DBS isoform X1 [Canis lupus familiaris]|uniref:guanine nucleotide exchange factor DBS isoform X1 n=1 Tax=Canis lupus familiaris TaxID=9615 RepID=UPI0018F7D3AB|nr:guanine nucleotide exchange factor DBS isoform X1 [Canis lupus familiaris]